MRAPMAAAVHDLSAAYPIGSRLKDDGRLEIGGCDALDLAREYGTPAIVIPPYVIFVDVFAPSAMLLVVLATTSTPVILISPPRRLSWPIRLVALAITESPE